MVGWLVVLAATGGLVAVARWYVRGGGVSGYTGRDGEAITRVRVETMNGSAALHQS